MDDTQKKGRAPVESTAVTTTSSSSDYATHLRASNIKIGLTQTHQSHHTHHIWEVAHG